MKYNTLIAFFLLLPTLVMAQEQDEFPLQVIVDSAFVRELPAFESTPQTSVYANDSLLAIGRNIDGQWLEVRRPGRTQPSGWISRRVVSANFDVSRLQITDFITGVTGPTPVIDTGFGVLILQETPLYAAPDRFSQRLIENIAVDLTLPVIERTPDRIWLKVNYYGVAGWLAEFRTSTTANLNDIPISSEYGGDSRFAALSLISPEKQLAQIDSLLSYIQPIDDTAANVAFYWQQMIQGETLECRPPAGNYTYYNLSNEDLIELPELRRHQHVLTQAIDSINTSIEMMKPCGIYTAPEMRSAYASALNARGIFRIVKSNLENLRERILVSNPTLELTG